MFKRCNLVWRIEMIIYIYIHTEYVTYGQFQFWIWTQTRRWVPEVFRKMCPPRVPLKMHIWHLWPPLVPLIMHPDIFNDSTKQECSRQQFLQSFKFQPAVWFSSGRFFLLQKSYNILPLWQKTYNSWNLLYFFLIFVSGHF